MFQRKLDETTRLLRELQEAQNERLSARPPPNTICLLGPSYRELHLGRSRRRGSDTWSACVYLFLTEAHFIPPAALFVLFFPAEQVTTNLKELAQQVTPGDVVSTYGVRKAMGISVPRPGAGSSPVDLTEGACPAGGRGSPAAPSAR